MNEVDSRANDAYRNPTNIEYISSRKRQVLRWWPAAILVALIFALPWIPNLFETAPLPVMMVSFMGPGVVGVLVLLWWLFASRAGVWEKLFGLVGVVLIAGVAIRLLHDSMQGMGATIHVVPAGAAALAIPLILLAAQPKFRLPVALACSALAFGYWDLIQSKGVTGRFIAELDWRWNATPEQEYIASLKSRKSPNVESPVGEPSAFDAKSAEWSNFRGPLRDGRQTAVMLEEDWKASPPKLLWQVPIGPAWSSFTVAKYRLFTQEQRGENEAVVCLDAQTGNATWVYEWPSRFWEAVGGAGPRGTPTIADEGLFALGANGALLCLDPTTGKLIWQTDLRKDAAREPPTWGFSASPLVTSGLAIVHAGGKGDLGILAYEVATGQKKWSLPSGDHSYSSPHLATLCGVTGVLMETNAGLQFLDAIAGRQLWQYDWPVQQYRALQPLVVGDTVLLASVLGDGTRRLKVERDGDAWKVEQMWMSRDLKPDFNDFVVHKGFLYGFDGNIFCCTDLSTGKRRWKRGRYGNGQVVLLPGADQLLIVSETGDLVLIRADSEKLVELGNSPAIKGKTWNHPVVVGDRVYVRNAAQAACYQVAVKK